MRDERTRLGDMLESIERVEKYTARGRAAFDSDELIQVWILHHLQVIGEAARMLTQELRCRYPEIPWQKITGVRHVLVHAYFGVNRDRVWRTAVEDLPLLRTQLKAILGEPGTGEA